MTDNQPAGERKYTLADLLRLWHQEERPTDPEELRMWKNVRHAKHYGMNRERFQEMVKDGSLPI